MNQIIIINSYTLNMSFFNQGLWDRKSSMEKPGLGRTADMATQYPPEELRRMLSGNPGRLSYKRIHTSFIETRHMNSVNRKQIFNMQQWQSDISANPINKSVVSNQHWSYLQT